MLNNKKNFNIIFLMVLYIVIVVVEVLHFGSDINMIILLESFICFSILLFLSFSTFKKMFVLGLHFFTYKYTFVYYVFNDLLNLNMYIYNKFISYYSTSIFYLIKAFIMYEIEVYKLKIAIIKEYITALILWKEQNNFYWNEYLKVFYK